MNQLTRNLSLLLISLFFFNDARSDNQSDFDRLYQHAKSHYSSALGDSLLDAAEKTGDAATLAKAHFLVGYFEDLDGMYYKAVKQYFLALKYYRSTLNIQRQTDCLKNLGILYLQAGFADRAISFYMDALQLAIELRDPEIKSVLQYQLGKAWRRAGDYGTALSYHQQAMNGFVATKNTYMVGETHVEMGLLEEGQENYQLALEYYSILPDPENTVSKSYLRGLNNRGNIYLLTGNVDSARILFEHGIEIARQNSIPRHAEPALNKLYSNLGRIYWDSGDSAQAVLLFETSLNYIEPTSFDKGFLATAKLLADYYEDKDANKRKLQQDAIFNFAQGQAVLQEQMKQEHMRYQVEAANYLHESEQRYLAQQRQWRALMITSVIALIAITAAFVIWMAWRKRKRLEREREQRAKELLGSLKYGLK